ncbi:Probable iron/ascorbate oxidoreductase DDB_G0283291 [Seminavis robusta]|uniref:Probable iron/ascorbate oxidoreductase DDB_G0283291 n=1 Tax=Seminavis robusta TaxID=568900 RepID=A0A9N8DL45_9STRA|nr:Probable iron/ascorbate oxidoreductase DDB_G0283291 [Seminavis robusta]|eukprot:Sro190_g081790.1 Probable iron/ascorbate oxidoreductase DDB_G0283291 (351) ;mRNA; r:31345-32478
MKSSSVPIIDLSAFSGGVGGDNGTAAEEQKKVAIQLRNACEHVGFFYITGHGCDEKVMDTMSDHTSKFFDMPAEDKIKLEARNNPLWRGYNSVETGAHSCTPEDAAENPPDLKESFTIGAESTPSAKSPMHGPNQWPDETNNGSSLKGFEAAARLYWESLSDIVGTRLMQALAMSLDLPPDFFTSKAQRKPHSQMVLLRYPPTAPASENSEGLEVRRADGSWMSAAPLKDNKHAFVVNLGDMMKYWTNDRYQSTEHRVTNPSSTNTRHSIPFFLAVDYDTKVETIASCRDYRGGEVYDPCQSGEYILGKLGLMHLAKTGKSSDEEDSDDGKAKNPDAKKRKVANEVEAVA